MNENKRINHDSQHPHLRHQHHQWNDSTRDELSAGRRDRAIRKGTKGTDYQSPSLHSSFLSQNTDERSRKKRSEKEPCSMNNKRDSSHSRRTAKTSSGSNTGTRSQDASSETHPNHAREWRHHTNTSDLDDYDSAQLHLHLHHHKQVFLLMSLYIWPHKPQSMSITTSPWLTTTHIDASALHRPHPSIFFDPIECCHSRAVARIRTRVVWCVCCVWMLSLEKWHHLPPKGWWSTIAKSVTGSQIQSESPQLYVLMIWHKHHSTNTDI